MDISHFFTSMSDCNESSAFHKAWNISFGFDHSYYRKKVQKLKSHLALLEEQGVPQMSREISSLRSQLTKTKAEQEALKQRNFKLQRALEERTKSLTLSNKILTQIKEGLSEISSIA